MEEINIRKADVKDFNFIASLSKQMGYEVSIEDVVCRYSYMVNNSNSLLLVAEENQEVVGWIQSEVHNKLGKYNFAMISGLVVDKNHRNKGIGTELILNTEKWCNKRGCYGVSLSSGKERKEAHNLYKKLGYINKEKYYFFYKILNKVTR